MTKTKENGNLIFHATVKTYLPPIIAHDFIDDDGELNYALSNGNTTLASRYNAVWNPPKGIVNMKAKGRNPDRTRIEY